MFALLHRHDARESWRVKRSLQGETAECCGWGVQGGEWFSWGEISEMSEVTDFKNGGRKPTK